MALNNLNIGNVLIIGCGSLGTLIANKLDAVGFCVTGAKRDISTLPKNLIPVVIDIHKPETLGGLINEEWSVIIVTLTADNYDQSSYQATYIDGMKNLVMSFNKEKNNLPLILFASSTSVYSQKDSEWVTEKSQTKPNHFSGKTMLKAEEILSNYQGPYSSVRFSGIYGRNESRYLSQLKQGQIVSKKPSYYTNRIHIEDCARVFIHLLSMHQYEKKLSPNYVASDCDPAPLYEVMFWLSNKNGIDADTLTEFIPKYTRGNKRCSNSLLLETGFKFKYPSYRDGMI